MSMVQRGDLFRFGVTAGFAGIGTNTGLILGRFGGNNTGIPTVARRGNGRLGGQNSITPVAMYTVGQTVFGAGSCITLIGLFIVAQCINRIGSVTITAGAGIGCITVCCTGGGSHFGGIAMTGFVHIVILIAVAAGAGVGGVSLFCAGGFRYFRGMIMAFRCAIRCTADRACLGYCTGRCNPLVSGAVCHPFYCTGKTVVLSLDGIPGGLSGRIVHCQFCTTCTECVLTKFRRVTGKGDGFQFLAVFCQRTSQFGHTVRNR